MWKDTQATFGAALMDPNIPPPRGLETERFAVHRNNFATGLSRALASRFPATERIVGEEFFAATAREFVVRHPPASPVLLEYGETFADFIEAFEPAEELFYLPDVMRLENARVRAYHAADRDALAPRTLAEIPVERLAEVTFELRPSVSVVRSRWPIVTIWSMNVGETAPTSIDDWTGEDALVARSGLQVETRRLPAGGASFIEALAAGAAFGAATQTATRRTTNFDLGVVLAEMMAAGVFVAISQTGGGR